MVRVRARARARARLRLRVRGALGVGVGGAWGGSAAGRRLMPMLTLCARAHVVIWLWLIAMSAPRSAGEHCVTIAGRSAHSSPPSPPPQHLKSSVLRKASPQRSCRSLQNSSLLLAFITSSHERDESEMNFIAFSSFATRARIAPMLPSICFCCAASTALARLDRLAFAAALRASSARCTSSRCATCFWITRVISGSSTRAGCVGAEALRRSSACCTSLRCATCFWMTRVISGSSTRSGCVYVSTREADVREGSAIRLIRLWLSRRGNVAGGRATLLGLAAAAGLSTRMAASLIGYASRLYSGAALASEDADKAGSDAGPGSGRSALSEAPFSSTQVSGSGAAATGPSWRWVTCNPAAATSPAPSSTSSATATACGRGAAIGGRRSAPLFGNPNPGDEKNWGLFV